MNLLINIDVPDLSSATDFYCRAMGLELVQILDGDVAELAGAGCRIYLLEKLAGTAYTPAENLQRDYVRHWTPVHMDFVVDDLASAVTRAKNAGAIQESECVEWKGSRCISFSDPFGHGFCLIEFSGDGYAE